MDTSEFAVLPSRGRRRHAPEFKARMIAACLAPGVSVAAVAQANGLNTNFLRSWVKAHREQQRVSTQPGDQDEEGGPASLKVVAAIRIWTLR